MLHTFILIHCDLKSLATCDLPPVPHEQFDGDCSDVKVIRYVINISFIKAHSFVETRKLFLTQATKYG